MNPDNESRVLQEASQTARVAREVADVADAAEFSLERLTNLIPEGALQVDVATVLGQLTIVRNSALPNEAAIYLNAGVYADERPFDEAYEFDCIGLAEPRTFTGKLTLVDPRLTENDWNFDATEYAAMGSRILTTVEQLINPRQDEI